MRARARWCGLTCVGEAEGPEAEVGGRVGDAAQAVLDGVDGLVHRHVPEVKLEHRGQHSSMTHTQTHTHTLDTPTLAHKQQQTKHTNDQSRRTDGGGGWRSTALFFSG